MADWPRCATAGPIESVRVDGPGDELSCRYSARDCGHPRFAASPKVCAGCAVHALTLRAAAAEERVAELSDPVKSAAAGWGHAADESKRAAELEAAVVMAIEQLVMARNLRKTTIMDMVQERVLNALKLLGGFDDNRSSGGRPSSGEE